jgi:type I restriction enzyme, S subunit
MCNRVKLETLSAYIGSGITPRRDNKIFWQNGTIPWLKTEQLDEHQIYETTEKISQEALDETSIKLYPVNTLSIAMYGEGKTRGNVAILKKEMTTNQACCNIIIDNAKADYEYVYYYLKVQYQQLRGLSSGVRKNLNSNDIKNFEISLPKDIATQQRIAAVLSALDAKIYLNKRINTELEVMAKALYGYWFVQFDFPDKNGKPYKSSGGKMVWNAELKREIPVGWDSITINQILVKGSATKKIQTSGILPKGLIPVIDQSTDFIAGYTNDINTIIEANKVPRIIFGDHTRVLKLINFNFARGADGTQVMLSNSYRMPQYLFYHTLLKIDLSNYGYARHYKFLKDQRIILPREDNAQRFNASIQQYYELIKQNIFENHTLSELREWLLPMFMNGQVKVN